MEIFLSIILVLGVYLVWRIFLILDEICELLKLKTRAAQRSVAVLESINKEKSSESQNTI